MRMLPPQLVRLVLELDGLREQLEIAVPLHKIRSPHERSVLAGAAVVVPHVEVSEIDGMRKRRPGKRAILVQSIDDVLAARTLALVLPITCSACA